MDVERIKNLFKKLCETKFTKGYYEDNTNNSSDWFYVQAGRFFRDYVHYECIKYNQNWEIQFHIEFNAEADSKDFYNLLPRRVRRRLIEVQSVSSNYKWYRLNTSSKVNEKLKQLIETDSDKSDEDLEKELYKIFLQMKRLIEPAIKALEKGSRRRIAEKLILQP